MSEERILQAISELGKNLSEQISATNTRLDNFEKETNARFGKIDARLNRFEEETRDNFVSMSNMIRHTNERITAVEERITKVDKKIDKRYNELGDLIAGVVTSVDTQFAKIKKVINY